MTLRILSVTHAYPRWDGDIAGGFIEILNQALAARGHEITVIAPADQGKGGEAMRGAVRVRRVRYASAARETLAYRGTLVAAARTPGGFMAAVGLIRALRRAIRAADVDVVHAHWWIPGGVAAWAAGSRLPFVTTMHGTDVALLDAVRPARVIARRVARRAAATTAVSTFLAERAGRAGITVSDVIPMPASVREFARQSTGGEGVFFVGRLTTQKRLDLLLDAVAHAAAGGRTFPLTIVGDGPERQALERRATANGIAASTRFLGMISPEHVPDVLARADVFAFPARAEGYGLAVAEALMMGIPVVVLNDGGGVLDIARPAERGGAGRILEPGDAAAFARALVELASDSEARSRAQKAGNGLRATLAPDAAAERFERVLKRSVLSPAAR